MSTRSRLRHRFTRSHLAIFALALTATHPAFAELTNDGLIGPGIRLRPAYDGADSRRGEIVPVIRYFGHPWFARSTQGVGEGGVRMALVPGLHLGAQLAYEPGRKTRESAFLESRNLPDVDPGASIGAHIEWDHKIGPAPITLLARVRQHIDSDRGAQADLRFSVGIFRSGPVGAALFTQATWATSKSTSALYGISPQQSVISGLPAFDPGGGLLFGSVGLLWGIELTKDWMIVGNVESRHLQGDAKASPILERKTNTYVAAGVAYRF